MENRTYIFVDVGSVSTLENVNTYNWRKERWIIMI